jgi:hypothetical protein
MLDEKLGIGDDLELGHPPLQCRLEPGDQRAVLGDVVGRNADCFAACVEHRAVLRLEHVTVRGRPRVPARTAVCRKLRPQLASGGSSSWYRSNAGSSYG